ncbi:MAG: NADP-dependent malic enzyme [Acidilobaceae archaeon]
MEKEVWESLSIDLHRAYKGKIEVSIKVPVESFRELSLWYTPGVAGPVREVSRDLEESFELTWRWNTVAVISDGSRVLGLGDVGPEAALPVMEGKALLFKLLGGVDAVPLAIREKEVGRLVYIIKSLEPSFGGVNLEDVESPKCFRLLEELERTLEIPVWHDDQQGTALVAIAGILNALKLVGKKLNSIKIVLFGVGASNIAIYRYLKKLEVNSRRIVAVDSKGVLRPDRKDLAELAHENPWKYEIALETDPEEKSLEEAFKDADVLIAASRPGPGVIKKEWVKLMNENAIVFALANPVPEIWPWEAEEAGAKIVATGRSDFPNQINNSLGFPAVFRGALTVRAKKITDSMVLAAARALAEYTEETGLSHKRIVPSMLESEAYVREALAVALKAIEEGVARRKVGKSELEAEIRETVERPKRVLKVLLENGLVNRLERSGRA